jgi:[histone H3]-lysine36 N-trimethyltransferase
VNIIERTLVPQSMKLWGANVQRNGVSCETESCSRRHPPTNDNLTDGQENQACGDDSCINWATKIECIDDECHCGAECQNQRFQRKQYADVAIIRTEKKGYGVRAETPLEPGQLIFEYIGEVVDERLFRRRMVEYHEEGVKHFYFMSLNKGEFIDATRKGNLGRFCNHSCNPNCEVDKWVVGNKLRMGIFAKRNIKAGEELVFNYNVDRYGADPQPCYCGEPNCTGFLGGKTQTERATKLSDQTIEALGIDDGDGWDVAVTKKSKRKKAGEDDEEYVNNVQPAALSEEGVTKVMATLMQCKEKWIAVKLLGRIQRCDEEKVRNRVVKMHGYQILKSSLISWQDDVNVVLQILDILYSFPRLTRNKIHDSKIETTVEGLKSSEDERVAEKASQLILEWSSLEVAYRIPRKRQEDADTPGRGRARPVEHRRESRRDSTERRERSSDRREPSSDRGTPTGPAVSSIPSGPRSMNNAPQRFKAPRPPTFRPRPVVTAPLPEGWSTALNPEGRTYFYNTSGLTQWVRPTQAAPPPPPPVRPQTNEQKLQDIIDKITKGSPAPKVEQNKSLSGTPREDPAKLEKKKGSWRSLPEEKQMKLYENTVSPANGLTC